VTRAGEKPMDALRERGVEYIEVRILDTNPFFPVGIDAQQIRFLDAFLLYCLLSNSPDLSPQECEEIKSNQQKIVLDGRRPCLKLNKKGLPVDVKAAAKSLLTEVQAITNLLDKAHGELPNTFTNKNELYNQSLKAQFDKIENSELTPSGLMMKDV
jgi:glutamate--cysteine ligase